MRKLMAFIAIFLTTSMTCATSEAIPKSYANSLLVVTGASHIKYTKYAGTDHLTYRLKVTYPAEDVITDVSQQLTAKGWSRTTADWLNLGTKDPDPHAWSTFEDVSGNTVVFRKAVYWKNAVGDITSYSFKYREDREYVRDHVPRFEELFVTAVYFPRKVVEQMRKNAKKEIKKRP